MIKPLAVYSLFASALLASSSASALFYDANVTPDVIFGSGNVNGAFTVDQNNGVELGLRGKLRHNESGAPENTFNSNGDGTYSFAAGVAPGQSSPTAVWSFEWSVNSNYSEQDNFSWNLSDLTYELSLDIDPSFAVSFLAFDPINGSCWDHSLGDNTTGNGGGVETACPGGNYSDNIDQYNVAQNSWKPSWFFGPTFDPTLDAVYDISLAAFDGERELARTSIQVIVGDPTEVPAPAPLALMGLGLLGLLAKRKLLSRK